MGCNINMEEKERFSCSEKLDHISRLLSTITKSGSNETTEYHHPDRLGTKLVSKPATASSDQQNTLPFGTTISSETTANTNQKFTSYDRSEATGLDYAVNRTYNPGQSRFTQVDPIGMASTELVDPQSMNLFAYTQNNPVDFVDQNGLEGRPTQTCLPGYYSKPTGIGRDWGEFYVINECVAMDSDPVQPEEENTESNVGVGAPPAEKNRCKEILQKIKELYDELKNRASDLLQDPANLVGQGLLLKATRIARLARIDKKLNPTRRRMNRMRQQRPPSGKSRAGLLAKRARLDRNGTVEGHQEQFRAKQGAITNQLKEWNKDKCKGGPGAFPADLRNWLKADAPGRIRPPDISYGRLALSAGALVVVVVGVKKVVGIILIGVPEPVTTAAGVALVVTP